MSLVLAKLRLETTEPAHKSTEGMYREDRLPLSVCKTQQLKTNTRKQTQATGQRWLVHLPIHNTQQPTARTAWCVVGSEVGTSGRLSQSYILFMFIIILLCGLVVRSLKTGALGTTGPRPVRPLASRHQKSEFRPNNNPHFGVTQIRAGWCGCDGNSFVTGVSWLALNSFPRLSRPW